MSFKDLELKSQYDSERDNLVDDFYVPVLSQSTHCYRAVGYFDSRSLSSVALGLKEFILKEGKMKLICGSNLSEADIEAIIKGEKSRDEVLTNNFLEDINKLEDVIVNDSLEILAWMVAKGLLEIKVAIKLDKNGNLTYGGLDGGFHYKIGIFKDGENYLSINGSNNSTQYGLGKNWEHFDVFKGWEQGHADHFNGHVKLFERTWNNSEESYEVISIPEAAEKGLKAKAPASFNDLNHNVNIYNKPSSQSPKKQPVKRPTLYDYQVEARKNWVDAGKRGIFAMATGTGKTYTALGCLKYLLDEEDSLVTIITAPYMHLVTQWLNSVESFGLKDEFDKIIVINSSNPKGMIELHSDLYDVDMGYLDKLLIVTTHDSYWRPNFVDLIKNGGFDFPFLFIADEMHGLGSYNRKGGLLPQYDYRLGLSATPTRHFDEVGTETLKTYFGDEVYTFSLKDALTKINEATNLTYLTPFYYTIYPTNLTLAELSDYKKYTDKIRNQCVKKSDKRNQKSLESAIRNRSNVVKNAEEKYDALREILTDLKNKGPEHVSHLLIYCSDEQIKEVVRIVGKEFGLIAKTFTSHDDPKPDKITGKSERDVILEDFDSNTYNVLVAMHCLDEGVDVPSATNAILMCNSTNPREFIQRIGRVVRRYPGKSFANVYDMMVKPSGLYPKYREMEKKIEEKERVRIEMITKVSFDYEIKD